MTDLKSRYDWKKVEAPKTWRPIGIGDELVGFYGGRTTRNGRFGQYEVVIVHVPRRGSFMVSGTRILQLLDASGINIGWPVRVVRRPDVELSPTADGEPRAMKNFDVFVAEGDPEAPEHLPKIKGDIEEPRA